MNNNRKILLIIIAAVLVVAIAVGVIIWKWPSITNSGSGTENGSGTSTSQNADDKSDSSEDGGSGTEQKIRNKDTGKKTVEVSDVVASSSDKRIVVPIYATSNPGMVAARLFITYDTEAFSFADCEGGEIFDNCVGNFNETQKKLIVIAQNGDTTSTDLVNVSGAGVIGKIILTPTDKAKAGTYTVTVGSDSEYANLNDELVKVTAEAGKIVIK